MLIVGAGGVVGKYAVALAKRAGVHVLATASPRSIDAVRAAGADEIIDRTQADLLDAVDGQVDVLLNLAPIDPEPFASYVSPVRDGGAVVSTTAFMASRATSRAAYERRRCSCSRIARGSPCWCRSLTPARCRSR